MTKRSYLGSYEGLASGWLGADQPAGAFRTFILRNNLQHLIDVAPGYRVNWCVATGEKGITADSGAEAVTVSWPVLLTFTRGDRPPNFDVRVAYRASGALTKAVSVSAALRNIDDNSPIDPSGNGPSGAVFYTYATTTVTSAAASWIIDTQITFGANSNRFARYVKTWACVEAINLRSVYVAAARFDVSIRSVGSSSSGNDCEAVGVQLREYT